MEKPTFEFIVKNQIGPRVGKIRTAHGTIQTPCFWPVGTVGAVKLLKPSDLIQTKAQGMLANTYHLMVGVGEEIVQQNRGLHNWSGWKKPLLTDSGGYQVMSLAQQRTLSEEGVVFRSHRNGEKFMLRPEDSIRIQRSIGADLCFMLDVCPSFGEPLETVKDAMERTSRWAKRNYQAFQSIEPKYGFEQSLWPVIQGGTDVQLRKQSTQELFQWTTLGFAIGGLAVGEPKELMWEAVVAVNETLPMEVPKHLLGVGTPDDLLTAIGLGVDSFDCVLPTRNARHGVAFTSHGIVRVKNERYKEDHEPLDPNCNCECCRTISKSFLRHLYFASEPTAAHWLTIHNVYYYSNLLEQCRFHIQSGTFVKFCETTREQWNQQQELTDRSEQ
ncbi:MAG: tRNA guanosine(34) transglycosylase Tgt [bacterium]|nr:tRNA guanosine(34) transglycosylase Tgt [bacterium]